MSLVGCRFEMSLQYPILSSTHNCGCSLRIGTTTPTFSSSFTLNPCSQRYRLSQASQIYSLPGTRRISASNNGRGLKQSAGKPRLVSALGATSATFCGTVGRYRRQTMQNSNCRAVISAFPLPTFHFRRRCLRLRKPALSLFHCDAVRIYAKMASVGILRWLLYQWSLLFHLQCFLCSLATSQVPLLLVP